MQDATGLKKTILLKPLESILVRPTDLIDESIPHDLRSIERTTIRLFSLRLLRTGDIWNDAAVFQLTLTRFSLLI